MRVRIYLILKRIYCVMISFSLICSLLMAKSSFVRVYGMDTGEYIYACVGYVLSQIKAGITGDFSSFYNNEEVMDKISSEFRGERNEDGSLTLNSEFMNWFYLELVSYMNDGIKYYPVNTGYFSVLDHDIMFLRTNYVNFASCVSTNYPDREYYCDYVNSSDTIITRDYLQSAYCNDKNIFYIAGGGMSDYVKIYIGATGNDAYYPWDEMAMYRPNVNFYYKTGMGGATLGNMMSGWHGPSLKVYVSKADAQKAYANSLKSDPSSEYGVTDAFLNYDVNADNSLTISKEVLDELNKISGDTGEIVDDLKGIDEELANIKEDIKLTNTLLSSILDVLRNILTQNEQISSKLGSVTEDIKISNTLSSSILDVLRGLNPLTKESLSQLENDVGTVKNGVSGIQDNTKLSNTLLSSISEAVKGMNPLTKESLKQLETDTAEVKEGVKEIKTTNTLMSSILDTLKSIKNWLVVDTVSGIIDSILNGGINAIRDLVDDFKDSFAPVGDVMSEKFPFSLPWDFIAIITSLSHTPEVPKFEIPISMPFVNYSDTLVLDMSQFEVVSKASRTFMSLLFAFGLIFVTRKFTSKGDGEE